ncbi:uncharacterized protein BT62DRAFT_303495 [Guyanagaster necrorhizus]|uniref:Uncharacterized protein n=1 Tax=Guyanagaster necrorhizus TaxID=856835 RepID=A0A9P7VPZ2_9AGAR|nr:uncharacterized protein BT62DRAFT_303495 [Guyanagaster necrorhizus MCA 3950]KAG7443879.1 hypothetical protein BT62DRAFT_303495 [Guyanagaster necrorhizus MCA 3950]
MMISPLVFTLSLVAAVLSASPAPPSCFPAIGFKMPRNIPASRDNRWCPYSDEYGFVGFSYEVTACQSLQQLKREFKDIRQTFNSRYIHLYGTFQLRLYTWRRHSHSNMGSQYRGPYSHLVRLRWL